MLRPRTRAALARTSATGVHVIVVTGRMFRVGAPVPRAGAARRARRLLPGRRRRRPGDRRVPAPRADPARAGARGDRRRARRRLPPQLLRRRPALRRRGDARGASATPTSRGSRSTRSATCATGSSAPRRSSSRSATRRRSTSSRRELKPRFARPALRLEVAAVLPRVRAPGRDQGRGLEFVAERLGFAPERDGRLRRRRERPRAARLGRLRRRGRERARRRPARAPTSSCPSAAGGRRRQLARGAT